MIFPKLAEVHTMEEYIAKLRDSITETQRLSAEHIRARNAQYVDKERGDIDVAKAHHFQAGEYVLMTYPSRPPKSCLSRYRGPLLLETMERDDIVHLTDIVNDHKLVVHVDRLRVFRRNPKLSHKDLVAIAARDLDEYVIEDIVGHRYMNGSKNNKYTNLEFQVRWETLEESEDTWLPYRELRDCSAIDIYRERYPELKIPAK